MQLNFLRWRTKSETRLSCKMRYRNTEPRGKNVELQRSQSKWCSARGFCCCWIFKRQSHLEGQIRTEIRVLNCGFALNLGVGLVLSSSGRGSPLRLRFLEMPGDSGRFSGFIRYCSNCLENREGASNNCVSAKGTCFPGINRGSLCETKLPVT